jgi:hypothetical protein
MIIRLKILLVGAALWLGLLPARALEFLLDLASHTEGNTTSYVASIFLEASENDFDEFVDGLAVISPGGDLVAFVTTESFSDSDGRIFPTFAGMTSVIFGDWTLQQTIFGLPFDSDTFRVQAAGFTTADLPPARIVSPAHGSTGVSPTPTVTFTGPANAQDIGVALLPESGSYPNGGFALLPGTATQHTPPFSLNAGQNTAFVIYYLPPSVPEKVTIGVPGGVLWSSWVSRAAEAVSRFTVGGGGAEVRILGPERLITGQFRWSFATEAGRTYDVEFNDDLNSTNWRVVQTIHGDGSMNNFTITPEAGAGFFRIARR